MILLIIFLINNMVKVMIQYLLNNLSPFFDFNVVNLKWQDLIIILK